MPAPVVRLVIRLPDGSYLWRPDPLMWDGYEGKQVPYDGPDRHCSSQRCAVRFTNRAAAELMARSIPGAKVVPYTRKW